MIIKYREARGKSIGNSYLSNDEYMGQLLCVGRLEG